MKKGYGTPGYERTNTLKGRDMRDNFLAKIRIIEREDEQIHVSQQTAKNEDIRYGFTILVSGE